MCLFGMTLAWVGVAAGNDQTRYSVEGGVACTKCHETQYVMGILGTVHAKIADPQTPAAQRECQSCHGPSATHMQFPMQVANIHFGKDCEHAPEVQNKQCLECHGDSALGGWRASAHGYEQVVCSRCHSMHDPALVVPAKEILSRGCTEACHQDLMGTESASDFSHALGRMIDGKSALTCADCHNPHGPLNSEGCIACHARRPDVLAKETEKAREYHAVALQKGVDCLRCHKGISHPIRGLTLEGRE